MPVRAGKKRRPVRPWHISAEGFRSLRHSCFLSREACAKLLGVSVRTIRHWDAGRNRVPWSVVRLLRLRRLGDVGALHDAWAGWVLNERTAELVSPNGYSFQPGKLQAWPILCEQARFWRQDFAQRGVTRHEKAAGGVGAIAPAATLQPEAGEAGSLPMVAPPLPVETTSQPTALFVVPLAAMPMAAQHMAMASAVPELRNAGVFAADPAMLAAAFGAQLPAQMQSLPPPSGSNLASLCNHFPEFVTENVTPTRARVCGPDSNTGLNLHPEAS